VKRYVEVTLPSLAEATASDDTIRMSVPSLPALPPIPPIPPIPQIKPIELSEAQLAHIGVALKDNGDIDFYTKFNDNDHVSHY
jgi:hypothetical protein